MKKVIIVISLSVWFASSCTKEEIIARSYPRVNTIGITNINSGGASFSGEIFFTDVPVRDHGFLWAPYGSFTLAQSDRLSLGTKTGPGSFDATAAWGLENGKTYYMRAYAISDDHEVFGDIEKFVSKGSPLPVITDLYPTLVTWGDTLTLLGDNFSVLTVTNTISINGVNVEIIGGNRNTLQTRVNYNLATEFSDVSIIRQGQIAKSPKQIQLKTPEIESVSPAMGNEGTEVTISGRFLATSIALVYFNGVPALLSNLKPNGVVVKVPSGLPLGNVEVKIVTGTGGLFDTSTFEVL
jgi:IPT/TIG domain